MIVDGFLPMGHDALSVLSWRMTGHFFNHALPALSFVAGRFEAVARRPICSLAELSNPVNDLLPLSLVNRYLERLLARGNSEKGECQIAADIRLRFRLLGRLQNLDQLLCLCGRLKT
jgi:hypothetical protein